MKSPRFGAFLLAATAFPVALPAAQELPLWEAGAGLGALTLPDYRGADERTNYVFPLPYVIYRGDVLSVDREGAKTRIYRGDRVDFDLSLNASNPICMIRPWRTVRW